MNTPVGVLGIFSEFYEFLPVEGGDPVSAWELEDGKEYDVLLTTNAGLYRYRLEDIVRVDGSTGNTPNISFVTKACDMANLAQDRIPGSCFLEEIKKICDEEGIGCRFAQIYADTRANRYNILLEPEKRPVSAEAFAGTLDRRLIEDIFGYRWGRDGLLQACCVTIMNPGFMENQIRQYTGSRKTSAQSKIPVMLYELPDLEKWADSSQREIDSETELLPGE